MRFLKMVEDVFATKKTVRLLYLMGGWFFGKARTIREWAKSAEMSPSETAAIIRRLKEYGVVNVEKIGNAHLVSLNQKSYIVKNMLMPVITANQEAYYELLAFIAEQYKHESIISTVKCGGTPGDNNWDGTTKIMVVATNAKDCQRALRTANHEVRQVFNVEVEIVVLTPENLRRENLPFKGSNYKLLAGKDPLELMHELERQNRSIPARKRAKRSS